MSVKVFFDAAHQLQDSEDLVTKACARLHGHTYHVVVNCQAPTNNRGGMVVDFKAIKNIINKLDHQFINDIFSEHFGLFIQSTAENIAKYLYIQIQDAYPDLQNIQVLVAEGYKGKDSTSYVGYQE